MIEEELEQPQQGAEGYHSPESDVGYEGGIESESDTGESDAGDILSALQNATPSWIDAPQKGSDGYTPPNSPFDSNSAGNFGNKTDYSAPFPESSDTPPADIPIIPPPNIYTFEMFDASDKDGSKALILDGFVFGPNDDGKMPDGMTGNDDFILPMNDGDDAYLGIVIDNDTGDVTQLYIAAAQITPQDSSDIDFTYMYVTLGNLSADPNTGAIVVENELCGDYIIPVSLEVLNDDGTVDVTDVRSIQFHGGTAIAANGTDIAGVQVVEDNPGQVSVYVPQLDVLDENDVTFSDINSIQFTTNGSDMIDVVVTLDAPGQITVAITAAPNSPLQDLLNTINNMPPNSILMKDPNGNLVSMPVEDCSAC
jgi:hypothetical protein